MKCGDDREGRRMVVMELGVVVVCWMAMAFKGGKLRLGVASASRSYLPRRLPPVRWAVFAGRSRTHAHRCQMCVKVWVRRPRFVVVVLLVEWTRMVSDVGGGGRWWSGEAALSFSLALDAHPTVAWQRRLATSQVRLRRPPLTNVTFINQLIDCPHS